MIPVIVGALGSVPLRLKDNLKVIDVGISIELIQKCGLLGSARILRNWRCKVDVKGASWLPWATCCCTDKMKKPASTSLAV